MSEKLVDCLAEKCNIYISDLKRPENCNKILSAVIELSPECFSAEDWSESLSYLLGENLNFETSHSAKKYCIQVLESRYLTKCHFE